jgi:hypothetical protein
MSNYEDNLKKLRDTIASRASQLIETTPADGIELSILRAYFTLFKDASTVLKTLSEVDIENKSKVELPSFKLIEPDQNSFIVNDQNRFIVADQNSFIVPE